MNAGKDRASALIQALANARLDNKPRYLHWYDGVYWIEKTPVGKDVPYHAGGEYMVVYPSGIYKSYDPAQGVPSEYPDGKANSRRSQTGPDPH
jgi:hypothetical protein